MRSTECCDSECEACLEREETGQALREIVRRTSQEMYDNLAAFWAAQGSSTGAEAFMTAASTRHHMLGRLCSAINEPGPGPFSLVVEKTRPRV